MNGKVIRLTNLKLADSGAPLAAIQVSGWSDRPSWRIDHVRFDNVADRAIIVGSPGSNAGGIGPYGLVDNCWFESTGGAYRGLYLYFGNDSRSWTTAHSFGTDRAIVVEDSVFNRTGQTVPGLPAIDSAYGGVRWVLRHSTLNNWLAVLHGSDSAPTSTLQFEFNHNTVRVSQAVDYALYIRGGTGVATGNNIGITGSPNNAGYNSAFKMVRDGPCGSGYPCFQQVGRGVVNGAEGSVPVYIWNNTYTPGNAANGALWSSESNEYSAQPGCLPDCEGPAIPSSRILIRCAASRQPFRPPHQPEADRGLTRPERGCVSEGESSDGSCSRHHSATGVLVPVPAAEQTSSFLTVCGRHRQL